MSSPENKFTTEERAAIDLLTNPCFDVLDVNGGIINEGEEYPAVYEAIGEVIERHGFNTAHTLALTAVALRRATLLRQHTRSLTPEYFYA